MTTKERLDDIIGRMNAAMMTFKIEYGHDPEGYTLYKEDHDYLKKRSDTELSEVKLRRFSKEKNSFIYEKKLIFPLPAEEHKDDSLFVGESANIALVPKASEIQ